MRAALLGGWLSLLACGGDDAVGSGSGGSGGAGGSTAASGGGVQGGGGSTPSGPGCTATCGSSGNDDCCASDPVPGGTFFRSYDGVTHDDMTHPATVSAFGLDRYEVTVGRFRAFVEANMGTMNTAPADGDGAHPLIDGSGWFSGWDGLLSPTTEALRAALACDNETATWRDTEDPARESLPINCVSWYDAFAFCHWAGGRLPTEAEWNLAAAGGDEQREYPWGSGLDASQAAHLCLGDGNPECGSGDVLAVGSSSPAGDGKFGQADLAGNVWEFVLDWWQPYVDPCVDCASTDVTMFNTSRGGGWGSPAQGVLAANRDFVVPSSRSPEIGFRCASGP
jgi:formylglycine-generating enzyme required for sulfatase activity